MRKFKEFILEKIQGYYAVVLDADSHREVKKLAAFTTIESDHVTIAFKPDEKVADMLSDDVGKEYKIQTWEYAKDDKIDALVVKSMGGMKRVDPGQAHITISHKSGVRPMESKEMLKNAKDKKPKRMTLKGKLKFVALRKK